VKLFGKFFRSKKVVSIEDTIKKEFAKLNPYGYCDGVNWVTCKYINEHERKLSCPYIKYDVPCGDTKEPEPVVEKTIITCDLELDSCDYELD
jgi:hypothetical protein